MMFRIFKNRIYIGLSLFVLLVALYFVLYPLLVVEYTKSKGDEIIAKVEKYKAEHEGLYPQSLRLLGIEVRDSDDICLYKGCEFYYNCGGDIGGEFTLYFYYLNEVYTYESVIRTWGKGTMEEERNMQLYKMYYKTMSPIYQEEVSNKWIYDSVYYSIEDSQNVAKVRLYYKRNGSLAARGYVLQKSPRTKTGNWIYYTDTGESFNVIHDKSSANGAVIESLPSGPFCGTGLTDNGTETIKICLIIAGTLVFAVWLYRRKKDEHKL